MFSDPRTCTDPLVLRALSIWDRVNNSRAIAELEASRLREELRNTDNPQAFAWATATCGRLAAYREQVEVAETLLTDALGRFFLIGDSYGKALVTSLLAIPQALRGNLRRCRELALEPFQSEAQFNPKDLVLMHCVAAMTFQECGEYHAAIHHLNSEYELVNKAAQRDRMYSVVANIGVILVSIGEFQLGLEAASTAWRLEQTNCADGRKPSLTALGNMVAANCHLDHLDDAARDVELLISQIRSRPDLDLSSVIYDQVAFACARTGRVGLAKEFLERFRKSSVGHHSVSRRALVECTETLLLEVEGKLDEAIKRAGKVFLDKTPLFPSTSYWDMAGILARCYARQGNQAESNRWARHKKEIGQNNLLSDLLSNQVRSNLRAEASVKFTDQELSCLRLSAKGQTSSDIGLKLGIKPRTVNFHFSKILRKLNAMNRQEAIAKAISANIIQQ